MGFVGFWEMKIVHKKPIRFNFGVFSFSMAKLRATPFENLIGF